MRRVRSLLGAILRAMPVPAWAGPPYDTDDPEPTDFRHWEIYLFGAGARSGGAFDGSAGVDLNYGAIRNVQLTATLPSNFTRGPDARGARSTTTLGVGAIYRLKGPLSLLASAGPSFGGRDGDKYHAYVALRLNF